LQCVICDIIQLVEIRRKLRKVGGSVMLPLPPEVLEEAGFGVNDQVLIRSRPGRVEVEAEIAPDPDAQAFMDDFLAEYGEAMAKLAKR
jgi:hypothetical protein